MKDKDFELKAQWFVQMIDPSYKGLELKDFSKSHPMQKQQYTHSDLQAAYQAGFDFEEGSFEKWYGNYKFEMKDGTG